MHPIVIVFVIFAGLGVVYFLAQSNSGQLGGYAHAFQSKAGLSSSQIVSILIAAAVLAVAWSLLNTFRAQLEKSRSNKRLRQ